MSRSKVSFDENSPQFFQELSKLCNFPIEKIPSEEKITQIVIKLIELHSLETLQSELSAKTTLKYQTYRTQALRYLGQENWELITDSKDPGNKFFKILDMNHTINVKKYLKKNNEEASEELRKIFDEFKEKIQARIDNNKQYYRTFNQFLKDELTAHMVYKVRDSIVTMFKSLFIEKCEFKLDEVFQVASSKYRILDENLDQMILDPIGEHKELSDQSMLFEDQQKRSQLELNRFIIPESFNLAEINLTPGTNPSSLFSNLTTNSLNQSKISNFNSENILNISNNFFQNLSKLIEMDLKEPEALTDKIKNEVVNKLIDLHSTKNLENLLENHELNFQVSKNDLIIYIGKNNWSLIIDSEHSVNIFFRKLKMKSCINTKKFSNIKITEDILIELKSIFDELKEKIEVYISNSAIKKQYSTFNDLLKDEFFTTGQQHYQTKYDLLELFKPLQEANIAIIDEKIFNSIVEKSCKNLFKQRRNSNVRAPQKPKDLPKNINKNKNLSSTEKNEDSVLKKLHLNSNEEKVIHFEQSRNPESQNQIDYPLVHPEGFQPKLNNFYSPINHLEISDFSFISNGLRNNNLSHNPFFSAVNQNQIYPNFTQSNNSINFNHMNTNDVNSMFFSQNLLSNKNKHEVGFHDPIHPLNQENNPLLGIEDCIFPNYESLKLSSPNENGETTNFSIAENLNSFFYSENNNASNSKPNIDHSIDHFFS